MTLVFSGLGHLVQSQFGINEIASTLAVGRIVGNLFTRKADASIFEALTLQYGLHVEGLPLWLQGLSLERSGTILGENQRIIPAKNTMPDTSIDTVEGVATFLVLILRYVESSKNIIDYIESLLKGRFGIIYGGELATTGFKNRQSTLPFSLRNVLRSFVNSVIDADADSPQHTQCLRLISVLVEAVGSSRFLDSSTRYSRDYHTRLLSALLGGGGYNKIKNRHHTFSAGSAMIALAALANRADVRVECITDKHRIVIPPESLQDTSQAPFVVILWLTQPPPEIADGPGMGTIGGMPPDSSRYNTPSKLPLYVGIAEISSVLARQLGCSDTPDAVLALWTRGMATGEAASWSVRRPYSDDLRLFLTDSFLETQIAAQIAPLVDILYPYPRSDRRHHLARKAASIFHGVYGYGDYNHIDRAHFKSSMDLVLISMAVGCLKSLIRDPSNKLSSFSWTVDCGSVDEIELVQFCEQLVTSGAPISNCLWMAACIWGGSNSSTHGHVRVHDKVMGIVCPQVTILLSVLHNPKALAEVGLHYGLMSLHEGSVPMLPRDPVTGYVLAGSANNGALPHIIRRQTSRTPAESEPGDLLLTLEPYLQGGSLSTLICGWHGGEVVLQLDPSTILFNLILPQRGLVQDIIDLGASNLINITWLDLLRTGDFSLSGEVGMIRTRAKAEWHVAAAGCVQPGRAMTVSKEIGADDIFIGKGTMGYTYILGCDDLIPLPPEHQSRQPPVGRPAMQRPHV